MTTSKEHILEAIRRNKPKTDPHPYPNIPQFPKRNKPILDEFKDNLIIGAGTWHEITSKEEAEDLIRELHPDAKIICSATEEIEGNRDISKITNPHDIEDVDVGIIRAQFGVAETGMVWMTQDDLKVNALGFLSQHLIILLNPDSIVRDMHEAYSKINLSNDSYSFFMLGPSATADIGAFMVRGAQGARSLSVFFM